jgi:hypothetical protein
MNIAIKKPAIKPTEILILSEDEQSFLLYLHYFFDQFKVPEQTKELEPHKRIKKILPKFKPEHKPRFYIITNPQNHKQLRITIFHPESNAEKILDAAKEINKKAHFTKIYCVFDYVFENKQQGNHRQYNNIIPQKETLKKKEIYLINSVPSYEYWLLTHFKKCGKPFWSQEELLKELETATKVKYEKNDKDFFKKSFQVLYKEKYLKQAISNCKKQDEANWQNNTPDDNPSSKIYEVVEYIKDFL